MAHMQNTVYITYTILSSPEQCTLTLLPLIQFRQHDQPPSTDDKSSYIFTARSDRYEISSETSSITLKLYMHAPVKKFILEGGVRKNVFHVIEAQRGYEAAGSLWSPGVLKTTLKSGESATIIASSESWEAIMALSPSAALEAESKRRENLLQSATINAQTGIAAELVIAADQFIISPAGRKEEAIRTHAEGDEVRSVIAGYHWFTDWGRDTMISLEGLTMVTGRFLEAAWILKTFASYINKGLIPNLFPEGKTEGLYHTADATLWFFHALNRYLNYTKDINLIDSLLDKMISVIDFHLHGTSFGIRADPEDSLLIQGMEGYQLTWMDAKVEDWVVTPRRGKAVEINALWYNAVAALYNWVSCIRGDKSAQYLGELSQKIKFSFNNKFWNEKRQYLYDVIEGPDGNDDACRPNQLIALSLDFPVLAEKHWLKVLNAATEKLLTPVGLRTLSEDHPDYKSTYSGNLKSRDASYHQGTVWAWLIGPYIDAFLRVFPQKKNEAHKFLYGFNHHLNEACIGSISEIFDAQAPYTPRGCIAQAWSVAEVLRCLIKTYPEHTG